MCFVSLRNTKKVNRPRSPFSVAAFRGLWFPHARKSRAGRHTRERARSHQRFYLPLSQSISSRPRISLRHSEAQAYTTITSLLIRFFPSQLHLNYVSQRFFLYSSQNKALFLPSTTRNVALPFQKASPVASAFSLVPGRSPAPRTNHLAWVGAAHGGAGAAAAGVGMKGSESDRSQLSSSPTDKK